METLRYEAADEIATITLDRPNKMNAYTAEMGVEIVEAMRRADEDREVRVIILTGAGRAFCAGADISMFAGNIQARESGSRAAIGGTSRRNDSYPTADARPDQTVIVAINGYALGIGATMTLPCDIRIMAEEAKLGSIFSRVGLMTELGSSYFLPRLVGVSRAAEMMLTGRHYTAAECLAMGLVSRVAPAANLAAKARELAGEIIQGSPLSLSLTRHALYNGLNGTVDNAMEFEGFGARTLLCKRGTQGIRQRLYGKAQAGPEPHPK